jgi:hypothetical protein
MNKKILYNIGPEINIGLGKKFSHFPTLCPWEFLAPKMHRHKFLRPAMQYIT